MSHHITKTYTVRCRRCRDTVQFIEKGKKSVIRFLKSRGWTLDPSKGWRCGKCSAERKVA